MKYHKHHKLFIIILFSCAIFGGCSNAKTNIGNFTSNSIYVKKNSELEEYLLKINNRLLMVSDNPNINCTFVVNNSSKKMFHIDRRGIITISRNTLAALVDEAQLAALLSYAIVQFKSEYKNKHSFNSDNDALKYDQHSMAYLAKAGYNPMAAIELQEIYHNQTKNHADWLNPVFLGYPVSSSRLATNAKLLVKLPKGAHRSDLNYQRNIGLNDSI